MKPLSTKEAAERLGVDASRIRRLIIDERLPAEKMGRDWFIKEEDLALVADRKPGRPKNTDIADDGHAASSAIETDVTVKPTKTRAGKKSAKK